MSYLFNSEKPKSSYHIWDGKDTACRMYSTGGIKPTKPKWQVSLTAPHDKELCQMCKVNNSKTRI